MDFFNYPVEILILINKEITTRDLINLCCLNSQYFSLFKSDIFWSDKLGKNDWFSSYKWGDSLKPVKIDGEHGVACFTHYLKKMDARDKIKNLFQMLDNWKYHNVRVDESALEIELQAIVNNPELYMQFIVAETKRISSNPIYCRTSMLIPAGNFKGLMIERSRNLSIINLACSLQEIISVRECIRLYESLLTGSEEYISKLCIEEVLVMASSIDPLFYDLLHYRNETHKWVTKRYLEFEEDPRVSTRTSDKKLAILKKLLDFKFNIWRKWDSNIPQVDERNLDHSLVLRAYGGLTRPTHLVYVSILEKLCLLLGIEIDINEISLFINSEYKHTFIAPQLNHTHEYEMIDGTEEDFDEGTWDDDDFEDEPQDVLFGDLLQRFESIFDSDKDKILWKRAMYIRTMDNVFKLVHWNYFKIKFQNTLRLQVNGESLSQSISLGNIIKESVCKYVQERTTSLKQEHRKKNSWLNIMDIPYTRTSLHQEPIRDFENAKILKQFILNFDLSEIGDVISCGDDLELIDKIGYKKGDMVTVNPNKTCYVVDVLVPSDCKYQMDLRIRHRMAREGGYLIVMRNNSFWTIPINEFRGKAEFSNDVYSFLAFDNIGEWSRGFDFTTNSFISS